MESINIKKLAKDLNLSTSTVSRAFRGNSDINPETKERILKLAKELNYQPNLYASSLREQKSKTIAVIMPELANNFFSQAVKGIERVARDKGYHTLIYVTDDDFQKEVAIINDLSNGRVDGIIMSASGEANDHQYLDILQKRKVPLVFFDRVYDDIVAPKITTNDYESSFAATRHLLEAGCKKVAFLVINKSLSIGKMRMQGYIDALEEGGISFRERLVIDCSNDHAKSFEIMRKALKTLKPDGLFASVERLAIASYYACHDLQLSIPEQVKVICFSSLEIAPLLNPSLSTITQPARDMGTRAATLLFNILEPGKSVALDEHVVLKSTLMERRSTGRE
ncbi:LacI family transcriptional regulator [Chitinophaga pendula]|uniref:LacI family DNA-binding transcriptional regulator n=1 Tax=Chitinophaga TaxID=79328 RepID=UPI000BAF1A13|nr:MULTISPECIES: LacI family DNA-binding transcriptional regulator [Chitinophaga]ASZ12716.1 LacI family transcriptional regulator [Chitinophaga sp. MD30]UCJ09669.1 LacI family transcriptional regulator [Chitinophaga pendula]